MLNIIVTASWILNELNAVMAPFGVTPAQYNVLRILGGSHPEALSCSEIGGRLLDRTPDVTRLLNRLEKVGLIERERSAQDRRVVNVRVSDAGIALLDRMNPQVTARQDELLGDLSEEEQRLLSSLLERVRINQ